MLKNKLALVTGASSGIGLACARSFAGEGLRLILAARRIKRLEDLASQLKDEFGTETHLLELDVDPQGVAGPGDAPQEHPLHPGPLPLFIAIPERKPSIRRKNSGVFRPLQQSP